MLSSRFGSVSLHVEDAPSKSRLVVDLFDVVVDHISGEVECEDEKVGERVRLALRRIHAAVFPIPDYYCDCCACSPIEPEKKKLKAGDDDEADVDTDYGGEQLPHQNGKDEKKHGSTTTATTALPKMETEVDAAVGGVAAAVQSPKKESDAGREVPKEELLVQKEEAAECPPTSVKLEAMEEDTSQLTEREAVREDAVRLERRGP